MKFLCHTLAEVEILLKALYPSMGNPTVDAMIEELEALRAEEDCRMNSTLSRLGAKGSLDPCKRPWSDA